MRKIYKTFFLPNAMIIKGFLAAIFLILLLQSASAALGIAPAIVELNFVSGGEYELNYNALSDSTSIVDISVTGDLAEYAELSTDTLQGGGSFKVKIKFPENVDVPGEHRLGIWLKERPPENKFIGTAINIQGAIIIRVPYPGKYVVGSLNIPDGNINEEIPVEARVINRGKDNLNVDLEIRFFTEDGKFIENMPFERVLIESAQDRYFRKFLNTSNFQPGNYIADALIQFGDEVRVNDTFKVGSLFVNVTNYTLELPSGGIQKFFMEIESRWNGNIKDVYADVNISNSTSSVRFRTPSESLSAWEKGDLAGFLDTTGFEGKYNSEITLNYDGESNSVFGELLILKNGLSLGFVLAGVILLLALILVLAIIAITGRRAFSRGSLIKKSFKGRT